MLCSRKFHPRLLGSSNMLHGPKNHIVCQSGFHNRNQWQGTSVVWEHSWQTWSPHFFAITFSKNFCFFDGAENPLTCSGLSSLPLPLCERLILLSPKQNSTDLMAGSSFVEKIFRAEKSGWSSSPVAYFHLFNSIYVWSLVTTLSSFTLRSSFTLNPLASIRPFSISYVRVFFKFFSHRSA